MVSYVSYPVCILLWDAFNTDVGGFIMSQDAINKLTELVAGQDKISSNKPELTEKKKKVEALKKDVTDLEAELPPLREVENQLLLERLCRVTLISTFDQYIAQKIKQLQEEINSAGAQATVSTPHDNSQAAMLAVKLKIAQVSSPRQ